MVPDGSVLIILCLLLLAFCKAVPDTKVSCMYGETCILPCTFQTADELVIHWQQLANKRMVHSYHSGEDQFTNQDNSFRGRTSLFHDQITHGNASLKLTGVRIQDEGRYQCYTSNAKGNKESFDMVTVKAPVVSVTMELVGDALRCTSRGIYPKPTLSWSTSPTTSHIFNNSTAVKMNEEKTYDISGTMNVLKNDTRFAYTCSVATDGKGKTITWTRRSLELVADGSDGVIIPCHSPNFALDNFTVSWSFNHADILSYFFHSNVSETQITEKWKGRVKEVSHQALTLSVKLEGVYVCELSHAEDTYVTYTDLKITPTNVKPTPDSAVPPVTIAGVTVAVFIIIIATVIAISIYLYKKGWKFKCFNRQKQETNESEREPGSQVPLQESKGDP